MSFLVDPNVSIRPSCTLTSTRVASLCSAPPLTTPTVPSTLSLEEGNEGAVLEEAVAVDACGDSVTRALAALTEAVRALGPRTVRCSSSGIIFFLGRFLTS